MTFSKKLSRSSTQSLVSAWPKINIRGQTLVSDPNERAYSFDVIRRGC
jgi:hypothetical protein